MTVFLIFLLGLAIGSFLNVLIDRLVKDESIAYPPSHCDHCKKPLQWYDLLPVVSFIVLNGKCRYCHKSISWQYPIVELLTGILLMFVAFSHTSPLGSRFATPQGWPNGFPWGGFLELLFTFFIISSLIVIFFTDLKYGIIPDKVVFPAVAVTVFFLLITNYQLLITNYLPAGIGAFLFFLAIFLLSKGRGMGFGDVKLSFLLGLLAGFPGIVIVLYVAFLTGAVFSIILILQGRKRLKETIAFGPFLVLASLLFFFFADSITFLWFLPGVLP